jgi:hypothetical protein
MGDLFPNDSDGDALRQMAERGIAMNQVVKFEFSIHVEDESGAKRVLEMLEAAKLGGPVEVVFDEGELEEGEVKTSENEQFWPSWTVYIRRSMLPSYEAVIDFQRTLARVCQDAGRPDGWTVELDEGPSAWPPQTPRG